MTELDVWNMALSKLGDEANIQSLTDTSVQASLCRTFYPIARSVLLDKHNWNFAIKEVSLVATTNTNLAWTYAYSVPTDFANIVDVRDISYIDNTQSPNTQNYSLQGGIIYSNVVDAVLLYTSTDSTSVALFTPLFVEALSCLLASYLAGPIIKGDVGVTAGQKMLQIFASALKAAIESDCSSRMVRTVYIPSGIANRA